MSRLLVEENAPRNWDADQFRMEGWIDTAPFEQLIGLRILEAEAGRAVLTMPFMVKLAQGGGLLHGGALTGLADTAVAMAIKTLLPVGTVFATTELALRFLAPVREGEVKAVARVTGPEGRSFFGEAMVTDDQDREIARFTSVFRVARGQGLED